MAYNPSLYMPYQTGVPAPMYQPNSWIPTQFSTMQPVNGLVSVTGIDGAKAYQLPPNSAMPLFDKLTEQVRRLSEQPGKADVNGE